MPRIGLGFDIDHTLLIDNALERVAFLQLLDTPAGASTMGRLIDEQRTIDTLLEQQRRGDCTIEESVENYVRSHGIELTEPAGFWIARYTAIALRLVDDLVIPMPGVAPMFARLRELEIPVAILTNGWNPLQQQKARRVGFEGDVLVSSELGMQKPDPRTFALLAERLGTADCWYVGDNPVIDIAGAKTSGWTAVWFDAEEQPYPTVLPSYDLRIHALSEVPELLEAALADAASEG